MKTFPWVAVLSPLILLVGIFLVIYLFILPRGWPGAVLFWVVTAVVIQLSYAFDFGYQYQANKGPKPKEAGWRATRFVKIWLTSLGWPLYFPLDLAMNLGRSAGVITLWWRQRKKDSPGYTATTKPK